MMQTVSYGSSGNDDDLGYKRFVATNNNNYARLNGGSYINHHNNNNNHSQASNSTMSNHHSKMEPPTTSSNDVVMTRTQFEKLVDNIKNNPEYKKEMYLQRLIGFYRIGSEIGTGNFSQVRLGLHLLTKGTFSC
jgi:serine/threonine-protein kinase NIM1